MQGKNLFFPTINSGRSDGQSPGKNIGLDLLIGVLIALVSIPISMGYAMVAGLPAIYGLYGSFLPILVYGLLTTSPRFVFGVDPLLPP